MRFKHFSDWNQFKLKQLSKIYDGTHQTPDYKDIGVKFVSVEDIKNLYATTKYITKDAFDRDFKISPKQNDVLMTRIGDIGTSALVTKDEPLAYYVSLALIKPYNNLNPQFLKYLIESTNFQHELWKKTIHVAFPKKINKEEIGECRCFIPDIYTQQIIGEFLLLIDNRIETQNKIIDKIKSLIKSLCSVVNKNKNVTLNSICDCYTSSIKESEVDGKGQFSVYGANGICGYSSEYQFSSQGVAIVKDGAGVGRCIKILEKKYSILGTLALLLPKSHIDVDFLWMILNGINFSKYIVGSGIPHIYFKNYKGEFIPSVNQNTIANSLLCKSLENKLINEKRILNAYEKSKTYLLSNLFI